MKEGKYAIISREIHKLVRISNKEWNHAWIIEEPQLKGYFWVPIEDCKRKPLEGTWNWVPHDHNVISTKRLNRKKIEG